MRRLPRIIKGLLVALSCRPRRPVALRFERSHINRKAILHIRVRQSLVGFIDVLDGDDFDVGADVMFPAKVEHLLGLRNAADVRAGERAAPEDQGKGQDALRLLRRADNGHVAIAAEQGEVGVDVVIGGDGVEDEIEAAGVFPHLIGITRDDDFVGPEAGRVFLLVG